MASTYPGLHMKLPWRPVDNGKAYFPYGDDLAKEGALSPMLQVREVAMMIIMDKITDKPRWQRKVFNDTIVDRWRKECMEQSEAGLFARIMQGKECDKIPLPRCRIVTEAMFTYMMEELRVKAKYSEQTCLVPTLDAGGNTVVKSDDLISPGLHDELLRAFNTLRQDQAADVDWHPDTNEMVQDMVHPSLYPFVYGRSNFLQDEVVEVAGALSFVGQGEPASVANTNDNASFVRPSWSNNYQWLPANVFVRDDGTVGFTSYINNLHPARYPQIYTALERLIDAVLPAWDQCLKEQIEGTAVDVPGRTTTRFSRTKGVDDHDDAVWEPFEPDIWRSSQFELTRSQLRRLNDKLRHDRRKRERRDSVDPLGGEEHRRAEGLPPFTPYVDEDDLLREKWIRFRDPRFPDPDPFEPIDYYPSLRLRDKFQRHGLQMIVKMASVELTPDKPEFPGGGWHIEGQLNERICATALYYVDCENVTSSHLSFRMETGLQEDLSMQPSQDAYNCLERIYDTSLGGFEISRKDSRLQTYGDVVTRQGRVLAFPNIFQHRVSSFRLKDPSKPGHRRFIALWLVDPHVRIVSTANVPPQQKDWWLEENDSNVIPEGLMTVEEARDHRMRLMEERSRKQEDAEKHWKNNNYSFCEH